MRAPSPPSISPGTHAHLVYRPSRIAPSLYDQAQISQPTRRYQDLGRHCPLARGSEKQHAYTIASPQPVELRRVVRTAYKLSASGIALSEILIAGSAKMAFRITRMILIAIAGTNPRKSKVGTDLYAVCGCNGSIETAGLTAEARNQTASIGRQTNALVRALNPPRAF